MPASGSMPISALALSRAGTSSPRCDSGPHAFLLQDYYVEEWAGNFMMHMLVEGLDDWWAHISCLGLAAKYGVEPPRAPKMESWGLRVAYVIDPCGVLWHIAERPPAR